jgi:hypothetical protein
MENGSYWRTRAIAEAQAQGYSYVRATCSGCGRITDIPWNLLIRPPRITAETYLGNLPLKCQLCRKHGDDHRRAASRQYPWLWASLTFCQRSGITPAVMNIVPIIPIRRREAFDNPAFLLELKYDGFRALADTVNGRMLSKNANRMRRFEKLLRRLPAGFGTPAPSAVQSHALDVARTSRAAHRLKASPQPG